MRVAAQIVLTEEQRSELASYARRRSVALRLIQRANIILQAAEGKQDQEIAAALQMVMRPEEYRWSSAAAHLLGERDRSGVLDMRFWERAGGVATWLELHARVENPKEVIELRRSTYAGRPFGAEEFVREMEGRFQRKWLRRGIKQIKESEIAKLA